MSIKKFENFESKILPSENGWFWILVEGYTKPIPSWYMMDQKCFLPGGVGDSGSNGLYYTDIDKIGPKIEEPLL